MSETAVIELLRRRVAGAHEVDDWGFDVDLVSLVSPLARLRWSVDVTWADRIPAEGPVVLVHNRLFGFSEPQVLAQGVMKARGRHVRYAGFFDVEPLATMSRAFGAVVDRPEELTGLLRSGAVVALPLDRDWRPNRAGRLDPEALAPALLTEAKVVPVALTGRELGRGWRMLVGKPIEHPPGQGPLAVAEIVDAAQRGVQKLLDASGHRWF